MKMYLNLDFGEEQNNTTRERYMHLKFYFCSLYS